MSAEQMRQEPLPFERGGKTYLLPAPDFDLELAFQAAQEAHALRRLQAQRREMGEQEYARAEEGWRHDLGANVYAWGGPLSGRFVLSDGGLAEYLYLLLQAGTARHRSPAVTRAWLRELRADRAAWDALADRVLRRDFPHFFRAAAPPGAGGTSPPSTEGPSPSSPGSPGAGPGSESSG